MWTYCQKKKEKTTKREIRCGRITNVTTERRWNGGLGNAHLCWTLPPAQFCLCGIHDLPVWRSELFAHWYFWMLSLLYGFIDLWPVWQESTSTPNITCTLCQKLSENRGECLLCPILCRSHFYRLNCKVYDHEKSWIKHLIKVSEALGVGIMVLDVMFQTCWICVTNP